MKWCRRPDKLEAIEGRLRQIERTLFCIVQTGETIMADMTNLNKSLDDLKAEVGDIGTKMDKLFADWQAANDSGGQAAIDAAAAAIDEQVAALKAISDRDSEPAPAPEPPAGA